MNNPTVLITGSSRGIGRAIALEAAKLGYFVILHGQTLSKDLKQMHRQIPNSSLLCFDVTDKKAVFKQINSAIKMFGRIDALVNNAGWFGNRCNSLDDIDDKKAIKEFSTNVLGTIHCCQAVIPLMIKQSGGSIVNISSMKGIPNLSTFSSLTYGATKAGVISITKSLAKKYAEGGIRINSVLPGYVHTDQVKNFSAETLSRIKNGILLNRMGQPEEIAHLVLFLLSDQAAYITGADFLIDGGYAIKGK